MKRIIDFIVILFISIQNIVLGIEGTTEYIIVSTDTVGFVSEDDNIYITNTGKIGMQKLELEGE